MLSVLIVEGYPDLRKAIVATLGRAHYRCVEVATAEDAIRKLQSGRYSAIVLDPRADVGSDPVMLYLRANQPEQVHNVVILGDEGLPKPFNSADLVARMPVR